MHLTRKHRANIRYYLGGRHVVSERVANAVEWIAMRLGAKLAR